MARASDPSQARLAATHIVRTLRDASHTAYFAGGCVRDELLGLHPTDYDVATDAPPDRIAAIFPRTSQVGVAFGVVLVHITPDQCPGVRSRTSVEVATFRADGPYSDARRPDSIRFSDDRSDAARRDFTINALFLDPLETPDDSQRAELTRAGFPEPAGRIIDHVRGLTDLESRIIRAVGDPDARLAEDHLRALRAVRFAARLDFRIEPGTANAIRRHASELRGVSRERIGEELRRMLAHPSRALAAETLQLLTLDAPVLDSSRLPAPLIRLTGIGTIPAPSFALCLAAWTLDRLLAPPLPVHSALTELSSTSSVATLRRALILSNDETEELTQTLSVYRTLIERWTSLRVAHKRRTAAKPVFAGVCALVEAVNPPLGRLIRAESAALAADSIGLAPAPFLTGDDLVAAGMKPGPLFKRILEEVMDAQLEGRVDSPAAAMELAGRLRV